MSVLFDAGARKLLRRAYARPGQWVGTRLADPPARTVAWAVELGINLLGPDNASTLSGAALPARTRWARAFIRSVYYQHKWHYARGELQPTRRLRPNPDRSVEFEVGRRVPVLGILPAGRAVRIRVRTGGQAATRAVRKMPEGARIYTDDGHPGGRWAYSGDRDW